MRSSSSIRHSTPTTVYHNESLIHEVKCVIVGDGKVGKTSMLVAYTSNVFPGEYQPVTIFENYSANVMFGENEYVQLSLWDTAGQSDFDRLRPLSYPDTDVFIVCFSTVDARSFDNARTKWIPEIRTLCPGTPIILVGTKTDMRENTSVINRLEDNGMTPVTTQMGQELQKSMNIEEYRECSARTQIGLTQVFDTAIRSAICAPKQANNNNNKHNHRKSVIKLQKFVSSMKRKSIRVNSPLPPTTTITTNNSTLLTPPSNLNNQPLNKKKTTLMEKIERILLCK